MIQAVTMWRAQCPTCVEIVSAAPRPTPAEAFEDLAAHLRIVHELGPETVSE